LIVFPLIYSVKHSLSPTNNNINGMGWVTAHLLIPVPGWRHVI
jgi:hypothetical protein